MKRREMIFEHIQNTSFDKGTVFQINLNIRYFEFRLKANYFLIKIEKVRHFRISVKPTLMKPEDNTPLRSS